MEVMRDPHFWLLVGMAILVFFGGWGYWKRG